MKFSGIKLTQSIRRKLIQTAAFGFCNARLPNFLTGRIYSGKWKNFCAPGLNCYSCPAAVLSCPIGAIQAAASSIKFKFGFYAVGVALAFGVVLGRRICGFLCPFGLLQELIHKIPSPKFVLPCLARLAKYALLVVFVFIMPFAVVNYAGAGFPSFCKYICPAGIVEASLPLLAMRPELRQVLGRLFVLKLSIAIATLSACVFVHRFFCKTMCPLGALYGLMNKISLVHLSVDKTTCINCGTCSRVCPMDIDPVTTQRSPECILCGKCAASCRQSSIKIGF